MAGYLKNKNYSFKIRFGGDHHIVNCDYVRESLKHLFPDKKMSVGDDLDYIIIDKMARSDRQKMFKLLRQIDGVVVKAFSKDDFKRVD